MLHLVGSIKGTYPKHNCLVRVYLHFLLNGFLLLLPLRLGQQGTVEHSPTVLDQNFDELELVVAEKKDKLVLTVSVIAGILNAPHKKNIIKFNPFTATCTCTMHATDSFGVNMQARDAGERLHVHLLG